MEINKIPFEMDMWCGVRSQTQLNAM